VIAAAATARLYLDEGVAQQLPQLTPERHRLPQIGNQGTWVVVMVSHI
jgi:hypothetical protein